MAGGSSGDGEWADPDAGGAADLRVGDDEHELVQPRCGSLGQPEVLDDDDSVPDVENLGYDERLLRVFRWVGAVGPGVAPGQRDPLLGEPSAELHPGAGLARGVPLVVDAPPRPPPGVEQNSVSAAQRDTRRVRGGACVIDGDDVAGL